MLASRVLVASVGWWKVVHGDLFTLTIGDPTDYQIEATPTLDGNVISCTDAADGGFDFMLANNLREKIATEARDACHEYNEACIQAVQSIIQDDGILDTRNNKRQEDPFTVEATFFLFIAWQLYSGGYDHRLGSPGVHVVSWRPDPVLSTQVAVVTETGKPPVTLTQDLSRPTVTGPSAPTATIYAEDHDDISKGSVVITFPDDNYAAKVDEIMARLEDCDSDVFLSTRDLSLFARNDNRNRALCGGRGVYTNAGPQGALAELSVIAMPNINFQDAQLRDALNQFIQWAREGGNRINLPNPGIDSVAVLGFVLGVVRSLGNTIQRVTVLQSQYLNPDQYTVPWPSDTATATATSSAPACSVSCEVRCAMYGAIKDCETACPTCSATGEASPTAYATVTVTPWSWPTEVAAAAPISKCDGDQSNLPWDVFKDVYKNFCTEVDKDVTKELAWLVDGLGNQAEGNIAKRTDETKRTPPTDASQYKDWRITLKWEPRDSDKGYCLTSCAETYADLQGGDCNPSGSMGRTMKVDGSVDNMCGVYSYHVEPPVKDEGPTKTPLKLGDQVCFETFPEHHGDVSWNGQGQWATWLCAQDAAKINMKAGDRSLSWTPTQASKDAFLTYTIRWIDGCITDTDSQSVSNPVDGATCKNLLRNDFLNCNNEGRGGYIDAGCLRYEFEGHGGG